MAGADKPIAALLGDLRDRGLLEDTVVIFCGEFGRTSYCEGSMPFANYGRDHQQLCGGLRSAAVAAEPGSSKCRTGLRQRPLRHRIMSR